MRRPGSRVLLRVLDANLNRAGEGLRVCEEAARLVFNDAPLTRRCQGLRYGLSRAGKGLCGAGRIQARNSRADVGAPARRGVARRHADLVALVTANFRRVEEALRVLEEFSRLDRPRLARPFGVLRFRAYDLEQTFLSRLSAHRHR